MQPVTVAFFWHQHQPYYPDDVSNQTLMPWVRLHATKDYYGMALHLKELPEFRCTINLVPSLLIQLQAYGEGRSDRHLDVSRLPTDGMTEADVCYLLDNFFLANVESMIRPYERYHELYLRRGLGTDPVENAVSRFSPRDLRDLQVWSNLTWIHELVFDQDPELREFRAKGRGYTEGEKAWLLDKQKAILNSVIPLHKELAASGQIELTTTPFYHPILPLLWDKRCARQAMPGCALPKHLESYREDAQIHLRRAVTLHKQLFGQAPVGMWPSEGSVSQDIVAPIAETGIEWIATDEEILSESTNGWISRDGQGHMRHPEMLYRPWRVESGDKSLHVIFRDHALSDLIGFHYQRSDPEHAAWDMISKFLAIGRAVEANNAGRGALVPVILDGENCWEYYPDGGVRFLRALYRNCIQNPQIRPQRVRDYLKDQPATDRIGSLFAGSWISHNFAIWIGHHEDNTAWDLLHQTREFLKQTEAEGKAPKEALAKAWEELFIAEGSDWYWWFGDDHSSSQDALFDELFRKHLQNVYARLDTQSPNVLKHPIKRLQRRALHTKPTGFCPVKVDGRRTYFEWICAGHYICGSERGTMTKVTMGVFKDVYFGFDAARFALRLDTTRYAREDLEPLDELRIRFVEPTGIEIRITGFKQHDLKAKLYREDKLVAKATLEVAVDQILEVTAPFVDLGLSPESTIQMYVEAVTKKQSVDRAPQEGVLEMVVPSPDFERIMWQA
ncbi:MAG TPA: glycoside hydrolase family 57 protein [Planctomycetaceae bacterium]|jgi:alpha-amylase/alpha-mannosidase (GH57 family)|nr:glycoside hydrolase family 57 protein [Planctomycetaceae bacterium]